MDYSLIRPCAKCPFRNDIPPFLREDRVWEIADSLVNAEFPCHETVDYDDEQWYNDDEEKGGSFFIPTGDEKHCAGALILLEKLEQPSQMMRICERFGSYDRNKLDMDSPVFDDFDEMADAQNML